MRENMFNEELQLFRDMVQLFIKNEIIPNVEEWSKAGVVSREIWRKAGETGLLGTDAPEVYGGAGINDFRYNTVIIEEIWRSGVAIGFSITNDLVIPYLMRYATDEQKQRWIPKLCSGEHVSALAMTEPIAGSDVAGTKTTAILNGDHYVVNGQKTFITNGVLADLVIVAVKTDPQAGAKGMSLLVLERGMEGFTHGSPFEKIGQKSQDTAEIFFSDVKVPIENRLGEEGRGFQYLMENLPQERMTIAVGAMAAVEAMLDYTIEYCQERKAFGQSIGSFQNSKFKLAEMKTEAEVGRVFIDDCILQLNAKTLSPEKAAMAYASYSESFKSGGWNAYFISTMEQFDYDAEYVSSVELGYKSTMMNNRLRLNAAYYTSKFTDFQVYQFQQTTKGQTFITLTNAGKVSSSGFELEASFIPVSGLTLSATLGNNDTNYDEFKDGGGPGVDYSGNKLEFSPENNNSFSIDYRYPVGNFGRLKFHYDKANKAGFFTNNNNNKETNWVEAHSIANLGVGLEAASGKWSINYVINNLDDTEYLINKTESFLRFPRVHRGLPKTSKFSVKYNF